MEFRRPQPTARHCGPQPDTTNRLAKLCAIFNVAQEQYTGGTVADMLAGLGLDQNFARTDTSGSYAMLPDLLGSTIAMVNSAEAITTAYQYGPVGRTTMTGTSSTAPSPARHGDCVKEQSSRRAALSRWARERAL